MSSYSGLWLKRAWRTRAVSADGRNALFLLGSRGAAYIEFLDLAIPLDASIAVPEGVGEYSQQSILQFFFMPRTAPGCSCPADVNTQPSSACIECLRSEDNYVLSIGDYPPAGILDGVKRLVPFELNGGWFHGVYAPLSGESDRHPTGSTNDTLPWWSAAIIDLVLVLAVWTLGCNLAALFVNPLGWKEAASLGVPLGFGILTLSVFLLSWAGFRLITWTYVIAWFLLMGVSWLALRLVTRGAERVPLREIVTGIVSTKASVSPSLVLLVLVIGFLAAQALVISVSRGYSLFDAIANWALKGYAIAMEGTIWAGARWGGHGLAYPQNLHLAIAMFRLFDGDTLPGSKLPRPELRVGHDLWHLQILATERNVHPTKPSGRCLTSLHAGLLHPYNNRLCQLHLCHLPCLGDNLASGGGGCQSTQIPRPGCFVARVGRLDKARRDRVRPGHRTPNLLRCMAHSPQESSDGVCGHSISCGIGGLADVRRDVRPTG